MYQYNHKPIQWIWIHIFDLFYIFDNIFLLIYILFTKKIKLKWSSIKINYNILFLIYIYSLVSVYIILTL
jgi:hypothetical protein